MSITYYLARGLAISATNNPSYHLRETTRQLQEYNPTYSPTYTPTADAASDPTRIPTTSPINFSTSSQANHTDKHDNNTVNKDDKDDFVDNLPYLGIGIYCIGVVLLGVGTSIWDKKHDNNDSKKDTTSSPA
tara:strand:- start:22 stop:417 length:396 start_codon:yes stop_codon:yes gene_type:complete